MAPSPQPYTETDELHDARRLLASAVKWLRLIEERADEVPHWFRHDADPAPLRRDIDAFLS